MTELIDRQEAIDALKICDVNEDGVNCYKCPLRDEQWNGAWQDDETNCYTKLMRDSAELLSVHPDKGLIHLQKEQAYLQGYEDGKKPRTGEVDKTF